MILLSILLTAGLDLSLPEFEPDDVSGNYIVSEYDVSGDEFVAVDVPAAELSGNAGLRSEAPAAESDDIVSAIQNLNDDNNNYWELFLDSYIIEVNHSLSSLSARRNTGWIVNQGLIETTTNQNYYLTPCPVEDGITYTVSSISVPSYNTYSYYVVDDLDNPTVVTNYGRLNPLQDPFSFTAGQNGYFVMQINYGSPFGSYNLSWVTQERESYTLSELGNAVMEIRSNNDMKFRILIFLTLINFAYPIVISSFKNFFGGGKNV